MGAGEVRGEERARKNEHCTYHRSKLQRLLQRSRHLDKQDSYAAAT